MSAERALCIVVLAALSSAACTVDFDRRRIPRVAGGSCVGLADCPDGLSCCSVLSVEGGSYDRGWDASDDPTQDGSDVAGWVPRGTVPATVSSFDLDVLEVSVGRMQRFVEDYERWRATGRPLLGEGGIPSTPGSGWTAEDDAALPADRAALEALFRCGAETWGGDPTLPANCLTFQVAWAFCIWDGARLPTEAEWMYAAMGGAEQRAFPWSSPPGSLTVPAEATAIGGLALPSPVGSHPIDQGRWGHRDLAGNVREWVRDLAQPDRAYVAPCADCVDLRPAGERGRRGGDFGASLSRARTAFRGEWDPGEPSPTNGVRCARETER